MHNAWFKGRRLSAADFVPSRREPVEQSPEEQMEIVDRLRARMTSAR
jgi:hypothetical protein